MDNLNPITIEAIVQVDLDKAWHFWTTPEHIINWNFAADSWHCPKAENDLKVGGIFTYTMAAKDGSFSFDFSGQYEEIIPGKKLFFRLGDDRTVEVNFSVDQQGTKITETFDPESQNPIEMQRAGWQAILDNFKRYVESI